MSEQIYSKLRGLTSEEVKSKKKLGLYNKSIDSYSPSYLVIIWRNFFNIINTILLALIAVLLYFGLYTEVTVFLVMIVISAILNTADEIRIKRRLDKIKEDFKIKVSVIRDWSLQIINSEEVVEGDLIYVKEGESIAADGEIVRANFFQIDESVLTGESEYLNKEVRDSVTSGSFVVTGECVYKAEKVGKSNYINQIGKLSTQFSEDKSKLEKYGYFYITFFVIISLVAGAIHFLVVNPMYEQADVVLSVTTIVTLIIPQTLLVIFSFSFVISISKLALNGVLVQKRGAIDELAGIDVICLDKTGTITTNQMKIVGGEFFGVVKEEIAEFYYSVKDKIVAKNKTYEALVNFFKNPTSSKITNFDQIPFNSKRKFSAISANINKKDSTIVIGAFVFMKKMINPKYLKKIEKMVGETEDKGLRVVIVVKFDGNVLDQLRNYDEFDLTSNKIALLSIKEELNPGINSIIKRLREQRIELKIITGDSKRSVTKILSSLDLENTRAIDFSEERTTVEEAVRQGYGIFARSKPEDKTVIIQTLQKMGKKVAMVGDGINDVIAIKRANVGIAMESGANVARDVADIVLLKNDYKRIPDIFYEGQNNIFNIKLITKLFMVKAVLTIIFATFITLEQKLMPILPTSTIIFSFAGSSFPAYILTFTRHNVKDKTDFNKDILFSGIPAGVIIGLIVIGAYTLNLSSLARVEMNTFLVLLLLGTTLAFTLYLIFNSKKLQNLLVLFAAFAFGFAFGGFQTLLPIKYFEDKATQVYLTFMIVWAAALIFFVFKTRVKQNSLGKLITFIVPLGLIPVAIFFPTRDYYAVTPINIEFYGQILALTLVFIVTIYFVNKTRKFLFPSALKG